MFRVIKLSDWWKFECSYEVSIFLGNEIFWLVKHVLLHLQWRIKENYAGNKLSILEHYICCLFFLICQLQFYFVNNNLILICNLISKPIFYPGTIFLIIFLEIRIRINIQNLVISIHWILPVYYNMCKNLTGEIPHEEEETPNDTESVACLYVFRSQKRSLWPAKEFHFAYQRNNILQRKCNVFSKALSTVYGGQTIFIL